MPRTLTQDANTNVSIVEGNDPRDASLENYKSWGVRSVGTRMGPLDEFLRVQNLPSDRVVTWATDPRIDNGRHLSFVKGLGFRVVEMDEVTTTPYMNDKLVLNQYEEGPHKSVAVGGGVLMIGYRKYRDERRKAQQDEMQARVDSESGKLDDIGIEQHVKSRHADLKEVIK